MVTSLNWNLFMYRMLPFIGITMQGALSTSAAVQSSGAAQAITAQGIAHHISVMAHDSMMGRDTPSYGLEVTANYVAAQFERLGLRPDPSNVGKENRSWFQRYPVPLRYDYSKSRIVFKARDKMVAVGLGAAARLVREGVPDQTAKATVVLAAGQITKEFLLRHIKRGKDETIFLYIPTVGRNFSSLPGLAGRWGQGLVTLTGEDSSTFHNNLGAHFPRPLYHSSRSSFWEIHVRPESVAGLQEMLATNGIDLARLRTDSTPVVQELPSLQMSFDAKFIGTRGDTTTAPNVMGVIHGSDSMLNHQLVVFSAHMDHVGVNSGHTDSVNNGAADASGVAILLELAKAFSQPGARPRRSLIFLAVSGGAKELWGSTYYALRWKEKNSDFFTQVARLNSERVPSPVADINLDMIDGSSRDSVAVHGLTMLQLAVPPAWVAAAHPELSLTVTEGGTVFSSQSDHFAFVSKLGLPSLSFQNRIHQNNRQTEDSTTLFDAEQVARIARLVFYVGEEIANADQPPQWTVDARRQLLPVISE